jgi:hypothetical protein
MIYIIGTSLVALYLISLPIRVKIKGGANMDMGVGHISVSVFYIPLLRATGLIEARSFLSSDLIVMQKKKKKEFHLDINEFSVKKAIEMLKTVDLSFLSNLDVKDIYINVQYGNENAFTTTLLLGWSKVLVYSLLSVVKCNQKIQISERFVPVYNMRTFKLEIHGIFSLSAADIIYGYIRGKLKEIKPFLPKKETA